MSFETQFKTQLEIEFLLSFTGSRKALKITLNIIDITSFLAKLPFFQGESWTYTYLNREKWFP